MSVQNILVHWNATYGLTCKAYGAFVVVQAMVGGQNQAAITSELAVLIAD
jgi:hypothetical protein